MLQEGSVFFTYSASTATFPNLSNLRFIPDSVLAFTYCFHFLLYLLNIRNAYTVLQSQVPLLMLHRVYRVFLKLFRRHFAVLLRIYIGRTSGNFTLFPFRRLSPDALAELHMEGLKQKTLPPARGNASVFRSALCSYRMISAFTYSAYITA